MGTLVFQATLGGAVNLIGPNISTTLNLTLPSADGSSGQALTTNGSGVLAFTSVTTAPGGSTTQVQYNNAGAFAGSANLTFNGTTLTAAGLAGPFNGTVGATTANTGNFTTLTTSSTITDNGGTANGVTYLNGSKVVTSGSALTFDGATTRLMVNASTNGGIGSFYVGNPSASSEYMNIVTSTSGTGALLFGNTTAATAGRYAGAITYSHTANTLAFDTSSTTKMLIDSSGNLGIGTSSPAATLDVRGTSPEIKLVANTGTNGVGYTVNNTGGNFYFGRDSSSGGYYGSGSAYSAVLWSTGAYPMVFATNNTERARITSGGDLYVGNTSASSASRLWLQGNFVTQNGIGMNSTATTGTAYFQYMLYNGSGVGQITSTGTVCLFTSVSDYRLKNTVAPMTGALAKVIQLNPVTYKWNSDGSDGQGFIAHELAEVFPEAVVGEKDALDEKGNPDYQGIDTSFLVATLTAAIQEQQTMIESLRQRLSAANL